MRILQSAVLAGVAAVVAGLSGSASAQNANTHVMTIRTPDGGLALIRYSGDVAPQVSFGEAPMAPMTIAAPMPSLFGADSPFAMVERISAEMDRRAAAMFRQADALMARAQSGQPVAVALRNLPPGSQSYSFVSTMSGSGVCSQSIEITSPGNGQPPRVVRHASGDCGPAATGGGAVNLPAAPGTRPQIIETRLQPPVARPRPHAAPATPGSQPDVILTGARGERPYAGLVREIPPAQR